MLLSLQVWGGLVLPTLLAVAGEARAYSAYRQERMRQLLLDQGRQLRQEQRYLTRASAGRRSQQAQSLGPLSLAELTSSSSGPSSPDSATRAEAAAFQAAALQHFAAPPGLLLPGDWQYEAVFQAQQRCSRLAGWAALPLAASLCLLYAWHVLAFA